GAAAQRLDDRSERLRLALDARFTAARTRLGLAAAGLRPATLAADVSRAGERFADVERRLKAALTRLIAGKRDAADNWAGRLATHSERHESLLERGYAVVWDNASKVVSDARTIRPGAALELEFYNGKVGVIAGGSRRPVRRSKPLEGQGSLFGEEV
ncbi:MAG: exodeoxyribonuclease VII large subunit, partial [Thiohalocapsa sp.]